MPCLVPVIGVVLCIRLGCGDVNVEGELNKRMEIEGGGKCQGVVREGNKERQKKKKGGY